ncbi:MULTISPECIES: LacI family DNA-binding transcriptional regulator [Paenibacillus]|uniref:LacI family DNA-binding transcriptional regulator n=1 Tax=Paenibacillus TaxID=44249 RepID=UPI0022B8B7D0|nr:LacI family DNA-binding transcriptional regulator [Paenibacillus caseinilyticus]MCZ8522404.1 LacI family DNA-binding transcriptional regulator [Paenibacillus caseinilyticus]
MSRKRQITIVDLAEAAGVSIATVSNVLNRRNVPMSEETIRKVEEAAEQLGYRRNVMAANLSRRKSYELGMLVPGFAGYYGRFAEEMQRMAHLHGYHLSVFSAAGFDPEIEKRHLDVLLQRRVDGLFCHGLAMSQEATRQIVRDGTPLVLFNGWGWPGDIAIGAVNLDFAGGVEAAVKHLYESGCRRIYYLSRPESHAVDLQRRIGFQAGLGGLPERVLSGILEIRGYPAPVEEAVEQLGGQASGEGPVGVIGFDDFVAFAFLSAVLSRGSRVPQDYKIVGINNDPLAAACYPGLTTLDIPYHEQAELAMKLMLEKLGSKDEDGAGERPADRRTEDASGADTPEIRIPLKLIPRMSTEP